MIHALNVYQKSTTVTMMINYCDILPTHFQRTNTERGLFKEGVASAIRNGGEEKDAYGNNGSEMTCKKKKHFWGTFSWL